MIGGPFLWCAQPLSDQNLSWQLGGEVQYAKNRNRVRQSKSP